MTLHMTTRHRDYTITDALILFDRFFSFLCVTIPHRLTSYGKYYANAVLRFGGVPILLSVLLSSPAPTHGQSGSSHGASNEQGDMSSPSGAAATSSSSLQLIVDQTRLNCVIILHNLSFSGVCRSVMHLYEAADGYVALCSAVGRCRLGAARMNAVTIRGMMMARTSTTVLQVMGCFV